MNKNKVPIAIVGMACRFPGGCNRPEEYWRLLNGGVDAISTVALERWNTDYFYHPDRNSAGRTYTKSAGQLPDVFKFDPGFFGLSPREATQMDPQQRLLLELTWEALEDGGQKPERLAGRNSSVFIGISSTDHANNYHGDPSVADGYFMTGNTLSIAANRISYLFDFRGPSMAIDTACSSSLVALHQACSSIWSGDAPDAIVGAAHLLLSPFPFIGFSKASMLSPDGRCKVFDSSANGYVRSEGGAVLYLKPLSQAEADGDRVHAVILGVRVNSDGRNSGLTVPNGLAQEALLTQVYSEAGITPDCVHYIEAHGTGTPVGDPIEAGAIGAAIGRKRPAHRPIPIGSAKSNIGHLEPASGVAGLLKVVMALEHRTVPASINCTSLNPEIDFESLNVRVVRENMSLRDLDEPLIMGVNSFGFGGSNAHVILGEYRNGAMAQRTPRPVNASLPLILSAASDGSLKQRARQFAELLRADLAPLQPYDVMHAAATRLQRLRCGLAVWADDAESLVEQLERFAQGERPANLITAERMSGDVRIAFVFSGNGSQWPGMARGLMRVPEFSEVLARIDTIFESLAGWSIVEFLGSTDAESRIDLTEVAQPALFAIQVGLLHMLRAKGVNAAAVVGHSVGEVAAAYAAGALTLEQAVHIIYHRSESQAATRGSGKMAAVRLPEEQAREWIAEYGTRIGIAAINSADSVTLSGETDALIELSEKMRAEGIVCRVLNLEYAFHSPAMDNVHEHFKNAIGDVRPGPCSIDFISTVTGERKAGQELDAAYWWDNVRRPVQFGPALSGMIQQGFNLFIEIGPHPILKSYVTESLRAEGRQGQLIVTLERDRDARDCMRRALYRTYLLNSGMDSHAFFPGPAPHVTLPPYPWDRGEYQITQTVETDAMVLEHPLLGFRLPKLDHIWTNNLDLLLQPWLADHVVDDLAVFPGAGYVEIALAASRALFGRDAHELVSMDIRKPLLLSDEKTREIQFDVTPDDLRFSIRSRDRLSSQGFVTHVTGKLGSSAPQAARHRVDIEYFKSSAREIVTRSHVYGQAADLGLEYGPAFQVIDTVWMAGDELLASMKPGTLCESPEYILHPVLLDGAFHTLFPALEARARIHGTHNRAPVVPVSFGNLKLTGDARDVRYCLCRISSVTPGGARTSIDLLDGQGNIVAELRECLFKRVGTGSDAARLPELYTYSVIPQNHINPFVASPLPDTDAIVEQVTRALEGGRALVDAEVFAETVQPLYDALAICLADQTLRELGAGLADFDVDGLLAATGVVPEHKHFVGYLLQMLEQDGRANRYENTWTLAQPIEGISAEAIWRSIVADHPQYTADMLETVTRGFRLAGLLTDRIQTETDSPREHVHPIAAQACRAVLEHLVRGWPRHRRRLRVADVRDRTSELNNDYISVLPPDFCDYEVLALDSEVRTHAEQHYRHHLNVNVTETEFTRDAVMQEFNQGEFDVVIVSDTLHKAVDVQQSLSSASWLLASNGVLLIEERAPNRLHDLNAGINPDWWSRSTDTESPISRRLEADEWLMALEASGFVECKLLTGTEFRQACHYAIVGRRPVRAESQDEAPARAGGGWLLLADSAGDSLAVAEFMREELGSAGEAVAVAIDARDNAVQDERYLSINMAEPDAFTRMFQTLASQECEVENIVFLPALVAPHSLQGEAVFTKQKRVCLALASFLQALGSSAPGNHRLWLISSGAVVPAGTPARSDKAQTPDFAPLWGFGRVIRNEYPDLNCGLIELQGMNNLQKIARALIDEIRHADEEDEVILNADVRQVLRLTKLNGVPQHGGAEEAERPAAFRLEVGRAGQLDQLRWMAFEPRSPGEGEISVRVLAAGLNFRDVMYASGLLPDEMLEQGFAGPTLGMECSGIVTRVGPGVTEYKPGDEVITFAPSCFSSEIITRAALAVPKPVEWSFAQAATVPVVFFTVYYALKHLAHLREGERILIHGAAGGVGLAAIQYARICGAEIFASAGTDQKREFLKRLGVEHILNSRSLDFADEIMSLTNGEGVDIVLNSLAGEAIDRNLRILRPFGRFLELGKRDFYEDTRIGLRPFRQNISYFAIDADQLLSHEPELSAALFHEVMGLFRQGAFRPLGHSVFQAADVGSAFRFMQQSRHIGKIIVSLEREIVPHQADRIRSPMPAFRPEASYLITGGVGGFGLETAKWMVEHGARHLYLMSRRGVVSEQAEQDIASMRAQGVTVEVTQCDVCDALALQQVVRTALEGPHKLRGVIHAAMVLDDGLIQNLNEQHLATVFGPKIRGAWNLHYLTRNAQLDFFVMYSSATTSFGNPGQSNYVAANSYLEALAQYRRALGLPGLAVAWDAISDSGYLTRNQAVKDRFVQHMGMKGITSAQALEVLGVLMSETRTHAIVIKPNWPKFKQVLPITNSPLFDYVTHAYRDESGAASHEDIATLLQGKTTAERHIVIANLLIEEVSRILHLPATKIDHHCALQDLGVDSLMAMELAAAIEARFSIQIPILALSDNASVDSIAAKLNKMFDIEHGTSHEVANKDSDIVTALAFAHAEDVSKEEVEEIARAIGTPGAAPKRLIQ